LENLSRTIRFKEDEIRLIEEFLDKNPFFDFSSLTRLAVSEFVKNPTLQIKAVTPKSPTNTKARSEKSLTS
jgi:hypothetical protein